MAREEVFDDVKQFDIAGAMVPLVPRMQSLR